MTKHTPSTCTVVASAVRGKCGESAVWSDGEFAECVKHAAEPGALAQSKRSSSITSARVGDEVEVHRYGKRYIGHVVKVGARGAVYARFTYGNGAQRVVRV